MHQYKTRFDNALLKAYRTFVDGHRHTDQYDLWAVNALLRRGYVVVVPHYFLSQSLPPLHRLAYTAAGLRYLRGIACVATVARIMEYTTELRAEQAIINDHYQAQEAEFVG